MTPFAYQRPASIREAVAMLAAAPGAGLLAGGTCLIDLMKQGVLAPATVVDLTFADDLSGIAVLPSGALRIGATTTLAKVARDGRVAAQWPLLHDTIVCGLTPQLRNAASFGGNIMQRPRCIYFREAEFACNKKQPGSGCAAQNGVHYAHAIFGGEAARDCIAVHPSDLCVALTALEAMLTIAGPAGERLLPIAELHRLPGDDPTRETTLASDELIIAIEVPPQGVRQGAYIKGTEGFTLASCAALIGLENGLITEARLVFGGVAHKPWRCETAEAALIGRPATARNFAAAAEIAVQTATTDMQTAFRTTLLRAVIIEALDQAAERARS